ncbi:variant surface glycoprotein (VSG), putative, (fragment) [Trypanosoma vivax Y486]|uniref:Variant surface glycoprotein (VSG), putative n=1 Tax=Trypanosoma vivax (strain Y486) TaxID=1055687 RepID=F9WMJ6_TRYVY
MGNATTAALDWLRGEVAKKQGGLSCDRAAPEMLPMCRAATGEDTGGARRGPSAPTYKATQDARSEALAKLTNTARMGDEAGKEDNTAPGFVAIAAQSTAQFAWTTPALGDAASAGIAETMIYLCNDHTGGSSNGCGSTAQTTCPCAPTKWVVKNGGATKPTDIQTGNNWNALKDSSGAANDANKVKQNWDTAKKICEATTHAPQRTRTVSTQIRHSATQLATRILHAENIATQHTTLLCLGTSSGTGCAGASGQETCICYTEGGKAIANVTEIPFIKAALEAAAKLEEIEHDYEAAVRLKSAWLTTNGHAQDADAKEESAEDGAAAVSKNTEARQASSSTDTQKRHRRGTREAPEATRQDGQAYAAQGQQWNPRTRTCEAQGNADNTHTKDTASAHTGAHSLARAASALAVVGCTLAR